jgi:hypothetical protein
MAPNTVRAIINMLLMVLRQTEECLPKWRQPVRRSFDHRRVLMRCREFISHAACPSSDHAVDVVAHLECPQHPGAERMRHAKPPRR